MSTNVSETFGKRPRGAPKIIISQDVVSRVEALAEGEMQRNPALAERLLSEICRARVVAPAKMPKNVISIGSAVTYRDETTGQEKSLTLVFPKDADISSQRVSVMTPVGVALLGLAEGAVFYWDTRTDQRRTLTVVRVEQTSGTGNEAG